MRKQHDFGKNRRRASARPGEWVVGFYPRPSERGLVAWAACVGRRVEVGDYEWEFSGRADAVYRLMKNGEYKRLFPEYHPGPHEFRKDTSAPALVFNRAATWYFGSEPKLLPDVLMHLAAAGQSHRVNGVDEGDVEALTNWLSEIGPSGMFGPPRHPPLSRSAAGHC